MHAQFRIGAHPQFAHLQCFAPYRFEVGNPEVQAARRNLQRQRGEQLVVVADQQWLGAHRAIDIVVGVQMADPGQRSTQFGNRINRQNARRRQPFTGACQCNAVRADIGWQRFVGIAPGFGQLLKDHRQHDIARLLDAAGQFAVGIQHLLGFSQDAADLRQHVITCARFAGICRCGLLQHHQFLDVGEAGVALGLKEEGGVGNDFSLGAAEEVNHPGVNIARPRPPSDIGDAGVIDGDDGDAIGWRA